MAVKNQKRCGTCVHIDRESYRGVKKVVCYKYTSDGIAMEVTDKKVACCRHKEAGTKYGRC